MNHVGKVQITMIIKASAENVAEGDRLLASHRAWMQKSHHREGEKALLQYYASKGSDLANPLDPGSDPSGKTAFTIVEVYETAAGIADHWGQAQETWEDFGAMVEWAGKADVTTVHNGAVVSSLW